MHAPESSIIFSISILPVSSHLWWFRCLCPTIQLDSVFLSASTLNSMWYSLYGEMNAQVIEWQKHPLSILIWKRETPGAHEVCLEIDRDPVKAWGYIYLHLAHLVLQRLEELDFSSLVWQYSGVAFFQGLSIHLSQLLLHHICTGTQTSSPAGIVQSASTTVIFSETIFKYFLVQAIPMHPLMILRYYEKYLHHLAAL